MTSAVTVWYEVTGSNNAFLLSTISAIAFSGSKI